MRSGVALVRGNDEEVTSRVVPKGRVANIDVLIFVRVLRFLTFVSSILLSPVSSVKQRAESCSYVSRSSRTESSIHYK